MQTNNAAHKSKLPQEKTKLPWKYAEKIAAALGYSKKYVYMVRMGHKRNAQIENLISLAEVDYVSFAAEIEKTSQATKILKNI